MSQAFKVDPDAHSSKDATTNIAQPRDIKLDDSVLSKVHTACIIFTITRTSQLQASGERERLALLLRKHLDECGWVEAVTAKCRGVMHNDRSTTACVTNRIHRFQHLLSHLSRRRRCPPSRGRHRAAAR